MLMMTTFRFDLFDEYTAQVTKDPFGVFRLSLSLMGDGAG
jgi:hypothetical protein